jgi:hypothetical protein
MNDKLDKKRTGTNNKELKKTSMRVPTASKSIGKKQLNNSYTKTIKQIQSELPPANRVVSKIVHNKVIEKITNIISSTIARPNAMLAGSFFAFILTLSVYITAKTIGYTLSGSETIASFIVGWSLGIIYDLIRMFVTGNKS